jgi:hypothetical protein
VNNWLPDWVQSTAHIWFWIIMAALVGTVIDRIIDRIIATLRGNTD